MPGNVSASEARRAGGRGSARLGLEYENTNGFAYWWPVGTLALIPIATIALWLPMVLVYAALPLLRALRKPQINLIAILGLLFLMPITVELPLPVETASVLMTLVALMCAVGQFRLLGRGHSSNKSPWRGVFLLLSLLFTTVANWPGMTTAQIEWRIFLFVGLVGWHIASCVRADPEMLGRAANVVAWSAAPLAVLAVYQRVTGTWPLLDDFASDVGYSSLAYAGRSGGTLGHPIIFGALAVATLCIAVGLRRKGWKLIASASLVCIVTSGSRSAWIATILVVCIVLASRKWKAPSPDVVMGGHFLFSLVLIVAATNPSAYVDMFDGIAERLDLRKDISGGARSLRLDVAWSLVTQDVDTFLFGSGPGADIKYLLSYSFGDGQAPTFDNTYLSLWINHGIITVLGLVLVLLAAFVRSDLTGKLLLATFITGMFFFEVTSWPSVLTIGILGWAFSLLPKTPSEVTAQSSPRNPRGSSAWRPVGDRWTPRPSPESIAGAVALVPVAGSAKGGEHSKEHDAFGGSVACQECVPLRGFGAR